MVQGRPPKERGKEEKKVGASGRRKDEGREEEGGKGRIREGTLRTHTPALKLLGTAACRSAQDIPR